jgi:hypothetical protein
MIRRVLEAVDRHVDLIRIYNYLAKRGWKVAQYGSLHGGSKTNKFELFKGPYKNVEILVWRKREDEDSEWELDNANIENKNPPTDQSFLPLIDPTIQIRRRFPMLPRYFQTYSFSEFVKKLRDLIRIDKPKYKRKRS